MRAYAVCLYVSHVCPSVSVCLSVCLSVYRCLAVCDGVYISPYGVGNTGPIHKNTKSCKSSLEHDLACRNGTTQQHDPSMVMHDPIAWQYDMTQWYNLMAQPYGMTQWHNLVAQPNVMTEA